MRYSFSTKGWHDISWQEFVETAAGLSFDGIEIHNLFSPAMAEKGCPADRQAGAATYRTLFDRKLSVPCINTTADIADPAAADKVRAEIEGCVEAAVRLKAPYVRLHTVLDQETYNENAVRAALDCTLPLAEQAGVVLLIETMGAYADTARLRDLLESYASDNLAALWDMHETRLLQGESAQTSITNLGAYIRHVHIKDSVTAPDGQISYQLIGEGEMPLEQMVSALDSVNYDGFISLEWDPRWMDELNDMTIILAHFINTVSAIGQKEETKSLYFNNAHTGNFVWEKESLISLTFSQVLDRMVEEFPDQYAFKYTTLDYTRTYAQFRDDVDACARAFVSMGVKAGTKVSVWATNIPAWFIAFWAATKIGAILVTVNTAYKIHEAEYLLRQSDTHTLVMIESCQDSPYAQIIQELCPELQHTTPGAPLHARKLPFLRNVVTVGFKMPGCLTWEQMMDRASSVPMETVTRMAAKVDIHDVCNMQYTSGTTGFPKGV
ncbi:MAG: AMP-binding protein, partial [Clostridia bacterium]|nr:AMP-binding protein [Clostridia bacterium]